MDWIKDDRSKMQLCALLIILGLVLNSVLVVFDVISLMDLWVVIVSACVVGVLLASLRVARDRDADGRESRRSVN